MALGRSGGIRWVASQVERFQREGRNYNRRVRAAWKRYGYEGDAPTVNLAELRSQIETGADLNRVIAQWRRFNENARPGSTRPVEHNGHVVPAQMVKEARYAVRRENARRKALLYDVHPTFDEYEPWEKATAYANKNLHPITKVDNPLEVISNELLLSDRSYTTRYTETLLDVAGSDPEIEAIAEAILDMDDNDPATLRQIFENSKYDQVINIDFIYDAERSADKTPWDDYREGAYQLQGKRNQIVNFWREKLRGYL